MKKLNLAVFNTQPPHLYFGGVERRIIETGKRLCGKVNTGVYSGIKAGFRKTNRIDGITFIPCFSTDFLFPIDNWFFNNTLASAVRNIKADVYEVHSVSGYRFLKALRKSRKRSPTIHVIHGVLADEYSKLLSKGSPTLRGKLANLLMWQLSKLEEDTAKLATFIVTVSKYSAEKIVQFYKIDEEKVLTVPNGVDTKVFRPLKSLETTKKKLGLDNRPCVLFVGRLIPRKGLTYLVEAAKKVVKEFKQTLFLIVGDGPLRNYVISYLESHQLLDNFVFAGDISDSLLPILYNIADVFILPSVQEGQGIALLEAQATAKPVVAFDIGGVRENILDRRSGFLVNPVNGELSEPLIKLLGNSSLRKKMGIEGRSFVKNNYSWDICANRMLKIYLEAIEAES
jgi:glycosyltransferase involved in cell wall biosynthesis